MVPGRYFDCGEDRTVQPGPAGMSLTWSSRAALAIAPLQDLLNLGGKLAGTYLAARVEIGAGDIRTVCLRITCLLGYGT
jgi:hypothetical protein